MCSSRVDKSLQQISFALQAGEGKVRLGRDYRGGGENKCCCLLRRCTNKQKGRGADTQARANLRRRSVSRLCSGVLCTTPPRLLSTTLRTFPKAFFREEAPMAAFFPSPPKEGKCSKWAFYCGVFCQAFICSLRGRMRERKGGSAFSNSQANPPLQKCHPHQPELRRASRRAPACSCQGFSIRPALLFSCFSEEKLAAVGPGGDLCGNSGAAAGPLKAAG